MSEQIDPAQTEDQETPASGLLISVDAIAGDAPYRMSEGDSTDTDLSDPSDTISTDSDGTDAADADGTDPLGIASDGKDAADADGRDS
jgi:hypothetical protein